MLASGRLSKEAKWVSATDAEGNPIPRAERKALLKEQLEQTSVESEPGEPEEASPEVDPEAEAEVWLEAQPGYTEAAQALATFREILPDAIAALQEGSDGNWNPTLKALVDAEYDSASRSGETPPSPRDAVKRALKSVKSTLRQQLDQVVAAGPPDVAIPKLEQMVSDWEAVDVDQLYQEAVA